MTTAKKSQLKVFLDGKGALEIEGLTHGTTEAHRLEETLGVGALKSLDLLCSCVRGDGLDDAMRERVRTAAQENNWLLEERDDLGPPPKPKIESKPVESTVDVIHQHSLGPTRREKAIIPVVILGVVAILAGIGIVVLDHTNHSYRPVRGPVGMLAAARQLAPPVGGLAGFINPDDSRYVSFEIRGWQAWAGNAAVTDGHLLYFEDLPVTVEELVKGERGSARIVLHVKLGDLEPPRFSVESIERAGIPTGYGDLTMEIHPVRLENAPPVSESPGPEMFHSDRKVFAAEGNPLKTIPRLAAVGYLERSSDGIRLRSRNYDLVLAGTDAPVFGRLLDGLFMTDAEVKQFPEAIKPKSRVSLPSGKLVTVFVEIESAYAQGHPQRQERIVGAGTIKGIHFGKAYIPNRS